MSAVFDFKAISDAMNRKESAPEPVVQHTMVLTLPEARDMLLPGLVSFLSSHRPVIDGDIYVEFPSDRLRIAMYNPKTQVLSYRYIDRTQINDGSYKSKFWLLMADLIVEVNK